MVAFRKLFPVLAVFALLLGASSAYAQGFQPLNCTANSGVPPVVRAEGYTELVGDIVVTCTGGNPANPVLANIQLILNTNITSRLLGSQSEALLMIDEPGQPRTAGNPTPFCLGSGACNVAVGGETYQTGTPTVFHASRVQDGSGVRENALVWAGVTIVPPGSTGSRTIRITNVRANASGLGSSQTLVPTQIVAFIAVNPPSALPIDNPQQLVGYVQTGMVFAVRSRSDGSSSIDVDQCTSSGANRDLRADPLDPDTNLEAIGVFRFREGFQTAFKPQLAVGQDGANPGVTFHSESGFVRTTALTAGTGIANSGTRLAVRFANVPTNMRVFVTTRNAKAAPAPSAVETTLAQYVATDVNGGTLGTPNGPVVPPGAFTSGSKLTGITAGGQSGNMDLVEVPITNGTGIAVWEVVAADPGVNEDFFFGYGVGYTHATGANQVGLGTGTVIGNLAPFYTGGGADRMSSLLPIPRFIARTETNNFINVRSCQTNLLFPYVTNWANFDTGISIANTSTDPFSDPQNRTQAGRCRLFYYGKLQNGEALTTQREETNAAVESGQTITMVLSTGGDLGLRGNPNMQGYIIAQCDFRFAHGFAFITDGPIGQARVAEGYLALVLDGPDSLRGSSTGEVRGH